MRILIINDDFISPPANTDKPRGCGGAAVIAASLARGYAQEGHDVFVLTSHQDAVKDEEWKLEDLSVTSLGLTYRQSLRPYLSIGNRVASRKVQRYFANHKSFDAIHVHNVHGYLTYASLRIARKHCKRMIITFHDVMSVHYGRLATPQYLRYLHPKVTLWDHWKQAGMTLNPLRQILIKKALQNTDIRIAVSVALKTVLEYNGIHIDEVIHNGIDDVHIDEKRRSYLKKEWGIAGKTVIFLGGRLRRDKGIFESLDAFRLIKDTCPNTLFLLVGEQKKVSVLLDAYPHISECREHIVTTGWLERNDLMTALSLSDICVTPSMCFDSFPTVNLEAMSLSVPVIATQYGGSQELVQDGETGFIINPGDVHIFAKKLQTLLIDQPLRERMGTASRKRVEAHFSLREQTQAYLRLFS